jgi:hypothetical protein
MPLLDDLQDSTGGSMTTLTFQRCRLDVDHERKYMQTTFEDGTYAPATPNYREDDVRRARELGYRGDTWQMTLDHEPLHTLIAEMMGESYSRILWNVAHGGGLRWPEGGREEEGYVTALQAYLRCAAVSDMLHGFLDRAHAATGHSKLLIIDMAREVTRDVRARN